MIRIGKIAAITMAIVMMFPGSAMASRKVNSEDLIRKTEGVTVETTINNGVTVFSADAVTADEKKTAFEMIKMLSGDPMSKSDGMDNADYGTCGALWPGQSEYHNDTKWHGSAMSYSWKRNTAGTWDNNFEGGQSTLWDGNAKCSYIILFENIDVNGIGVTISWPPSISGNGSSGSWTSQPIYSSVAGSSFSGMKVSGTATSVSFSDGGDVYVGNSVYRPITYIKFSFFS